MRKLSFVLFAILLLTSCGGRQALTGSDDRPLIIVSIEPMRYFVEALAGDRFEVTTLMPPGSSPEVYEPTPAQMVSLNECKAYIRVGTLGFEGTRLRKIENTASHLYVVDASHGIRLLPHDDGCDASDGGDPHTWTSPANAKVMARNIFTALCGIDTAGISLYTDRLKLLEQKIDSVDAVVRERLKDVKGRMFLIQHPALGYFARDYGLRQLSVEHNGKEPSADRVGQLISTCRSNGVKTVFVQKEYAGKMARRIAEEIGARVVDVDLLSCDWEGQIINAANMLADGDSAVAN